MKKISEAEEEAEQQQQQYTHLNILVWREYLTNSSILLSQHALSIYMPSHFEQYVLDDCKLSFYALWRWQRERGR